MGPRTSSARPNVVFLNMLFFEPRKRIVTKDDLAKWEASKTHEDILSFIVDLQNSVEGLTNQAKVDESDTIKDLVAKLDVVIGLVEKHPVVKEKDISRFGKSEFCDFYDEIKREGPTILASLVPEDKTGAVVELSRYFGESWGDRTRIDYGLGHELNFLCFFYCLHKLGVITKDDYPALVLRVFCKYISIMRQLQKTYWLEPAGSHGVWGLDDYHFLPFLFGASQLAPHPHMKPKSIHNKEMVESFWEQYMYFECIHFINSIKTVPGWDGNTQASLRWHSPMLDDILSAKSWAKIKEGMIKMYKAEVLGKLPIIQHFMFGSIIQCPEDVPEHSEEESESECGHVHNHLDTRNTWGDCCGIKIPSAIAASQMIERNAKSKPVPFD